MKATDLRLGLLRHLRWHRRKLAAACLAIALFAGLSAVDTSNAPSRPALVTLRQVPGGATVSAADVATVQIPEAALPEAFLVEPAEAAGRVATVTLPRGAILLPASIVTPEAMVGPGMSMIAVTLAPVADGLVDVGDRLDLVTAGAEGEAATVASSVRVVGLPRSGSTSDPFGGSGSGTGVLALIEVPTSQAAQLSVLSSAGPLAFVLTATATGPRE